MVWVLETNSQRHINKRQTTRNLLKNGQLPFFVLSSFEKPAICRCFYIYILSFFVTLYIWQLLRRLSHWGFYQLKGNEETNLAIGRVHWLSFDHFRAFFSLSHLLNGEWTVRKLYFLSNICFKYSLSMMAF